MVSDSSYISKLPSGVAKAHPAVGTNANQSEEIWSRILQEVSSKNNNITQGSVIFLGNDQCGKSSLIFRMTNGERQNYSSVLEYNYLVVHADPDGSYAYQLGSGTGLGPSDSVNLPLWTLDGKEELAPLLKFAFPPQLAKCTIVLCVSLEQPGNILPALRKWYRVIEEQIRAFYSRDEIEQAKQMQVRFWQEYVEPIESSMHIETASRLEIDPVLLPPEQGVLDENCGAAIIVAVTKSDTYADVGEYINKVQYHVRQFCLQHGAALIYTSAKEEKNTQLLYKYLSHRVFSLPFTHPAYIVENDSIFIPSGWDSEQKLGIIRETLADPEVPLLPQEEYHPVVHSARGDHRGGDQVVETEDEQVFLQRLHVTLQEGGGGGAVVPISATPKRDQQATGGQGANKNTMGSAGDSNTLASFFNSLLKKDPGNSSTSTPSGKPSLTSHVDAEAHFQKMLGKPQASSTPDPLKNTIPIPEARLVEPLNTTTQPQDERPVEEETESDISSAGSGLTPREAES